MYYFNIQDILKKHQKLTTSEILLKHIEIYGFGNRHRIVTVLNKLVKNKCVDVEDSVVPQRRGKVYYYSLKQ